MSILTKYLQLFSICLIVNYSILILENITEMLLILLLPLLKYKNDMTVDNGASSPSVSNTN